MTGLLGSTVLEVAIGMAFLYLLLALFCTTANEWIAGILKTRSKLLEQALKRMLAGQPAGAGQPPAAALVESFYAHPLISRLMRDGNHPSYVPARSFAKAIMDLVTPQHPGSIDFKQLENGIKALPDGDVKKTLLALIQNTGDLESAQKAIEGWFDDTMDRVSGWYKRKTQLWTVIVAAVITIATNADTVHIAYRLWTDPAMRSVVSESAKARAAMPRPDVTVEYKDTDSPTTPQVTSNQGSTLTDSDRAALGQMLGWNTVTEWGWLDWLERVIGWILTIIAVSLGAPFWFDTLNKIINIRNTGKSPQEKPRTPEKPKLPPEHQAA